MFQTLTFAVISTALAANCFAAGYSLDCSARSVDESSVPKSLCAGDTLSLKVSDSVSYTLTIADELPRFGESRPFSAHLGDGARTATAILRKDGLFVEIRDIARARLVRATVRGSKVQVEEIDLSNSSRGGCIEVEAPADAVESGAKPSAVSKKLLSVAGNPYDDNVVAPNGAPVCVDIMLVFDNGARAWVESQEAYDGSIANFAVAQVAKMNGVLANTGLHTNFWYRLVDVMTVDTAYTVVDENILGIVKKGAESGDGPYGPIKARRAACGADLVSLMIDTGKDWGTTGIGYITHGTTYNTWLAYREWCYSCCAIRSVDREYTLSHEVGHNMGLAHSPTLAGWTKPGTFDYSNGYNFWGKDDGKPYHTIMAYDRDVNYTGYIEIPYFSSPDYTYQGTVIGTALSNDCTRALRETCAAFAAWHDTAIPLPSDVTFHPSANAAFRVSLSNTGGYEMRYTTDGSTPTRGSALYSGPFALSGESTTVKAIAIVDDDTTGAVASKTYSAAMDVAEYAFLEAQSSTWAWGEWCNQSGAATYPTYWNNSSDKGAAIDVGGVIALDRGIEIATLVADGTVPLEIKSSGYTLSAVNLNVIGETTLSGAGFSFNNWKLHDASTLVLSPGEGNTVVLDKYLAQAGAGSTLAITNGTLSVAKTANSGDGVSVLQNASLRIDAGGVLSLEQGWILGFSNKNPVTVNRGGLLRINQLESTARPLNLDGGRVEVAFAGRAYELRGVEISVTDDSTIADVASNGGAKMYLIGGDSTFSVSEGKTLTVDIATSEKSGIVKRGLGEVKFLRELAHAGTNTVAAGTFTIGYDSTAVNCALWKVASGATLKVAEGKSLAVPALELASSAILDLPSAASAPLAVSNSLSLAGVSIRLSGAAELSRGASYPLIAASGGCSGLAKIDGSMMPALAEGLAWKFAEDSKGALCATVVSEAEARAHVPVVGVDESLSIEIPDDASSVPGAITVAERPLVIDGIGDTAVAFTLDVEIPDSAGETEQTICSWIVKDANVVRCVRRADGVLDIFYNGDAHLLNITNSVALASGRHTIKIGYNYGKYGGTWAFVDDAPAYWSIDLKWHEKEVAKLTIGATADATPQLPFPGLVLRGLGILKANSASPLPNMTGTSGIEYNYLIQNKCPTNAIPSVFPNAIAGGFSMGNSLLDAALPISADSITVSMVASFPADRPGCLAGVWTKSETKGTSYTGQIDYNGDGTFSFSPNGYVGARYYSIENAPDASVENPHLYTVAYTKGEGFKFYQDGVHILTAAFGYSDNPCYVCNKVVFGRGPWNNLTTSYNDNPNPMSNLKVYASHIELGSGDRDVSEAAVMSSLGFDALYEDMAVAEKLLFLPGHQTAYGVEYPPEAGIPTDAPDVVKFTAASKEEADAYAATLVPRLTREDVSAGLETSYLKVVANEADESGAYTLAVAIDPAMVAAPVISGGEDSAGGDKAFVVTEGEEGVSISVVIENAVKGLWYGYEVKDVLGDEEAFENDVDSFTRALGSKYRLKASTPRPAKSSGFFRVKALPANPIRSNR